MKRYWVVIVAITVLAGCSHNSERVWDSTLGMAVDSLWSNPVLANAMLEQLESERLSESDRHIYNITRAHARLKLVHALPLETDLEEEGRYCESRNMRRFAGEAYYIAGAYCNLIGENATAMQHLKQAEHLFEGAVVPDILVGMTYYKMGRISETEQLYDVANRYYVDAVPHLDRAGLALYAACGWREVGRTTRDSAVRKEAFEKALSFTPQLDTLTSADIRYAALSRLDPMSDELVRLSRFLCDSAGQKRYAYDLVRYYLREHRLDSARMYLNVLAADTAEERWSRDKYAFLLSRYQHELGQNAQAYATLLSLYNKQSGEIEATGMSRTFTISEQFDNASEREKNLQLQVEKQRLWLALFIVAVVILAGLIVLVLVSSRRRAQRLIETSEREMQIARLRSEVEIRRASMGRLLAQRIQLSKSMQESMKRHQEDKVPAWVQEFVETNLVMTEEQWALFQQEFNANYSNYLVRLKQDHPSLTASDLQVIALTVLGVDISDICRLLNLTKRTIWGRRLRIKEHLGLSSENQLDEWLLAHLQ